jgi:sulfur-oxidizing protein SoxY
MRIRSLLCGVLAFCVAPAFAEVTASDVPDPETPIWTKLKRSLFDGRPVAAGAHGIVKLAAPSRAEDGAVVPIAIRAGFAQTAERYIRRIYLIVDNNPSPLAATFELTVDSGWADLETRIRIEQYSHVRAVAELSDGTLAADASFVKASGGCSAAAGSPRAAPPGRMRLAAAAGDAYNQPTRAELMISHPNDSGLVMDQVTRLYTPAYFVRSVNVSYAGTTILAAEVDFSISTDPYFRFYFVPRAQGQLKAQAVDTKGLSFETTLAVQRSASGVPAAPAPQ